MNKKKWVMLTSALALMGAAASLLAVLKTHQRLGEPAVKTSAIPGSIRVQVDLPTNVLDYISKAVEVADIVTNTLPPDTSFGQRVYLGPDQFPIQLGVVLMGSDRTSIHKTEFCLQGTGWKIDRQASCETTIQMDRPRPYDLPVMKFIASHDPTPENPATRAVYVCWFVAANDEFTPNHITRMWWLARDLFSTGVLQRWALVFYFSPCAPGQENATFDRMKKFIQASVPEFQLVPRGNATAIAARP